MKRLLLLALLFPAVKSYGQWYNAIPPVSIPYIPVQRAAPVNVDYAAIRAEFEVKRAEIIAKCSRQTEEFYKTFTSSPVSLQDGWYKVRAVDNVDLCDERLVYVRGGRITRYFIEELYEKPIEVSSLVEKGLATVKIAGSYVKCYFLDNLVDPSAHASEPRFGSISFYTNYTKLKGDIMIYIDGLFVGKLDGYYGSGVPNCDQQYTVTVAKKPGIYSFVAKNEKLQWSGQIEIKNGSCYPYQLPGK